jgi:probable F420-dependent oxidoreductase
VSHTSSRSERGAGFQNQPGEREVVVDGDNNAARQFRFGAVTFEHERAAVLKDAARAGGSGYDILVVAEHAGLPGPWPVLTLVAEKFPELRIGTYVLTNDLHNPFVMAKDALTVDVLSDGRLELGLGAGYVASDYTSAGAEMRTGRARVERLAEAVQIAKMTFRGEPFDFDGKHYRVTGRSPTVPAVQKPHPPIMIGGGGRRLLTMASTEADIVSIVPAALPGGGMKPADISMRALREKVSWVRQAAGDRFDSLELNVLIRNGLVTTEPKGAAEGYLADLYTYVPELVQGDAEERLTEDDVHGSPWLAFGTTEAIVERLLQIREELGVSYFTIIPHLMGPLEAVVAKLAGT